MDLKPSTHDVVIVGAGIIGLTIARHLLLQTNLSVAVVDAEVPCSGATGAGQGYIWLGHKTPGDSTWELARRSKELWEEMAAGVERDGFDAFEEMGWKKTGSLLIGRTLQDVASLKVKVNLLSQAGLRAEFLSAISLVSREPELEIGGEGGAAFFPDDCQLDASRTIAYIEKVNNRFTLQGRYVTLYNNPVTGLVRSEESGAVEAVQTLQNILYGKIAVVIAAGAWTGPLLRSIAAKSDVPDIPVEPRKGHLLVLEDFNKVQLNHGLMEVGYIEHQAVGSPYMSSTSGAGESEQDLSSISMTATMDMKGNLILGSSRQFDGFNRNIDVPIVKQIWDRAAEFFPALREVSLGSDLKKTIRVGHRPYMPDGKPVIGHVPRLPKLLLAAGHEGNGLCMALGTAEMVADMIQGHSTKVDCAPFSIDGRFC